MKYFYLLFLLPIFSSNAQDINIEALTTATEKAIQDEIDHHFRINCTNVKTSTKVRFYDSELQFFALEEAFEEIKNLRKSKKMLKRHFIYLALYYPIVGFDPETGTVAANKGCTEIGNILLEHDADIYYTAEGEATAFYYAARNGAINFMELLKKQGGDFNFSKANCGTPLIAAVKHDQKGMVKYLLKNDANPLLEVEGFITPFVAAKEKGEPMVNLFSKYVCKKDR